MEISEIIAAYEILKSNGLTVRLEDNRVLESSLKQFHSRVCTAPLSKDSRILIHSNSSSVRLGEGHIPSLGRISINNDSQAAAPSISVSESLENITANPSGTTVRMSDLSGNTNIGWVNTLAGESLNPIGPVQTASDSVRSEDANTHASGLNPSRTNPDTGIQFGQLPTEVQRNRDQNQPLQTAILQGNIAAQSSFLGSLRRQGNTNGIEGSSAGAELAQRAARPVRSFAQALTDDLQQPKGKRDRAIPRFVGGNIAVAIDEDEYRTGLLEFEHTLIGS